MILKTLDGKDFFELVRFGAASLKRNCQEVNDLNVFPIPDGDTGTNMCRTIEGGLTVFSKDEDIPSSLGEASKAMSRGMLLSARGNSGVILAQIFRGICKTFAGVDKVTPSELADSFIAGIKQAYGAVVTPVEGTILTVFREASEFAKAKLTDDSTINDYFINHFHQAKKSLAKTIDLLPVLKENNVIDSGGQGYVYIVEGFLNYLGDKVDLDFEETLVEEEKHDAVTADLNAFTSDDILIYGYCTEFIMRLQNSKVNIDEFDVKTIIAELEADDIKGESIVAFKDGDIIKVHVHTMEPGIVLHKMRRYGEFLTTKIENMALQHNQTLENKNKDHKKYAIVAVADGREIANRFIELGADAIIEGGQTFNPSIEDFIKAYDSLDAEHIIVFPNNSNIMLSAKQSANLYEKKGVDILIVNCLSIPACYSALTMLDYSSDDLSTILYILQSTVDNVSSLEVTVAVRNRHLDGIDIHNGDYIVVLNGDVVSSNTNEDKAILDAIKKIENIEYKEVMTIIYGKYVNQDSMDDLISSIHRLYPDLEIVPVYGEQEVYRYYIALE